MTFGEFSNMVEGYMKKEEERYREEWDRVRWQTTVIASYSGNVKKGHRLKPTDLITFEWDKVNLIEVKQLKEPEMIKILDNIFPKQIPS